MPLHIMLVRSLQRRRPAPPPAFPSRYPCCRSIALPTIVTVWPLASILNGTFAVIVNALLDMSIVLPVASVIVIPLEVISIVLPLDIGRP